MADLFKRDEKTIRRVKVKFSSTMPLSNNSCRLLITDFDKDVATLSISKDNNLNKAHIKYLENHLYILAKESKRYEVVNSNVPTEASIILYALPVQLESSLAHLPSACPSIKNCRIVFPLIFISFSSNRKRKYAGCGNVESITCACEFGKL